MVEIVKINYEKLIVEIKAMNPTGYYDLYTYLATTGELAYEGSINGDIDTTAMGKVLDILCDLDPEIKRLSKIHSNLDLDEITII